MVFSKLHSKLDMDKQMAMATICPEKPYIAFAPSGNNKMGRQSLTFALATVQLSQSNWRTKDDKTQYQPVLLSNPPCLCKQHHHVGNIFMYSVELGNGRNNVIFIKLTRPLDNPDWGNVTALYLNEGIARTWDRKGVERDFKAYLSTEVCSKVHIHAIDFL